MVKKFFVGFTSIILSVLLFSFICLFICYQTVLKREYINKILVRSGYYNELYHSIQDGFADYAPSLHIEDEVTNLDSIISLDMIIRDVGIIVSGIYNGKDIKIDTKELENNLDKLINDSLSKHKISPSDEDKKYLGEFKKNIIHVYRDKVFMYVEKYVKRLFKDYKKIKELSKYGIWGLYILFYVFLFVFLCLNRNFKDICKGIGTIFLTCMFLSVVARVLCFDRFKYVLILSKPFSRLLIFVIRDILTKFLFFSSILGIVGFIFIIIGIRGDYPKR